MSLNWREIDTILDELSLAGGFIQNIIQPDFSSLVLELFIPGKGAEGRFSLYISLQQGKTRIHRISAKIPRQIKLQRFPQLLRSRIKGCRILTARQVPGQRMVEIKVLHGDKPLSLWLRLWGNAGNIILCRDNGEIIDAFYRRPARGEVSGGSFLPWSEEYRDKDEAFTLEDYSEYADYNSFIEDRYSTLETDEAFARSRNDLLHQWRRYWNSLKGRLKGIENAASREEQHETEGSAGDLILASLHRIQTGDRWLETEDYTSGNTVQIPLDPALSPQENAQKYYSLRKKKERRRKHALEQIDDLRRETEQAEEFVAACERAETLSDLEGIPRAPEKKNRRESEEPERPGAVFFSREWQIIAGRSAAESDKLLREWAKGNDYWIHVRDYPGGHIFLRGPKGKSPPLDVLLDAGNLALHYSKARRGGGGDCYYTQVKYLRRPREAKLGTVLPTQEKNLSISLDEERLHRLLDCHA
ncbi:NFACT RNA binding domain-containing protein [Marispirochaeta sp.]|jgi:predicted ribosome quality control (RQC) complex YloA/Tae2 family protein|uniref:NFACT RNA binding domain-containing protein n=1 Tax=Marispirochaeta sp. TaxID=2038653 RepID=UPI0029C7B664|nr:NFACT RNA binding domain-containing protein [Marispirochaeta sp.]